MPVAYDVEAAYIYHIHTKHTCMHFSGKLVKLVSPDVRLPG